MGSKLIDNAGTIVGALGTIAGWAGVGEGRQDKRQITQQGKLNEVNEGSSKRMADYEQGLKMQMWKDTNYKAQLEQAEIAGVSKAAAIGGSGGGGTQGASVSNVTGGSAADAAATTNARTSSIGMGMQLASQLALQKAQKENIEADTVNKKAGTENTGVVTAQGKVNLETSRETQKDAIDTIRWEAQKKMQDAGIAFQENVVRSATQEAEIKRIKTEAAIKMLEEGLTKEKITLTRAQINEISEKLAQGWKGLEYQGTDKITGKYIEKVADWLGGLGGKK